jgi:hypothetical protein
MSNEPTPPVELAVCPHCEAANPVGVPICWLCRQPLTAEAARALRPKPPPPGSPVLMLALAVSGGLLALGGLWLTVVFLSEKSPRDMRFVGGGVLTFLVVAGLVASPLAVRWYRARVRAGRTRRAGPLEWLLAILLAVSSCFGLTVLLVVACFAALFAMCALH